MTKGGEAMQKEMVQEITKLVVEELNKRQQPENEQPVNLPTNKEPKVSLYGKRHQPVIKSDPASKQQVIDLYQSKRSKVSEPVTNTSVKVDAVNEVEQESDIVALQSPEDMTENRLLEEKSEYLKYTPARVAVGRAGSRPRTSTLLKFRYDHAAAVDAVYGEVSQALLDKLDLFTVETKVEEKEVYIRRPDLGRRLSEASVELIKQRCEHAPTVQIISSNGLSASAVDANLEDVYLSFKQSLDNLNIQTGTTFYAHQGRVGLMDDVGEILQPEIVVNLIGERPGLVSAESMSAYVCYKPRHGTIESERMVISNIHQGGIPPIEAGAYLGTVIERMLKHKASGVALIQKEG